MCVAALGGGEFLCCGDVRYVFVDLLGGGVLLCQREVCCCVRVCVCVRCCVRGRCVAVLRAGVLLC